MIIQIGADELILWLRKNRKANHVDNRELGARISELIKNHGGEKINDDATVYWPTEGNNISNDNLPIKAAQYRICTCQLDELYCTISGW